MLKYNHGACVDEKKFLGQRFLRWRKAAILKASSDCFSMTLFGKEFQSLIVRAVKLCWYLFVLALT